MGREDSVYEGKTLDDAVRKGLEALGLSRAEVMITMVEEGSGGFLGLGARPYRVRVMPRPGGAIREPVEREERGRRDHGGRRREGGRRDEGGRGGRGPRGERSERGPRAERGPRGERGERGGRDRDRGRGGERPQGDRAREPMAARDDRPRDDRPRDDRPRDDRPRDQDRGRDRGPGPRPLAEARPVAEARPNDEARAPREERGDRERGDRGRRRRRGRGGRSDRPERPEGAPRAEHADNSGQPSIASPEVAASPRMVDRSGPSHEGEMREWRPRRERRDEQPVARDEAPRGGGGRRERESTAPTISADEAATRVQSLGQGLLDHMGFKGTVTATTTEDQVQLALSVPEGGELLAGDRGEVRQSLQHILSLMLNRGDHTGYHVQLEINDFWQRREQELNEMARRLADEAIESGNEAVSEYLNAQERRIVHTVLREDSRVRTYALGTGLIKRVAVAPAESRASAPAEDYPDAE